MRDGLSGLLLRFSDFFKILGSIYLDHMYCYDTDLERTIEAENLSILALCRL